MSRSLWRVVKDARRAGAIASGISAMIQLAHDDFKTSGGCQRSSARCWRVRRRRRGAAGAGQWGEGEQLAEEAVGVCDAHGYETNTWPCRYVQGVVAA